MNPDAQATLKRRRFEELMQAGRDAYGRGQRRLAHDHWREAATLDPYNEQVWLSLFRVLDSHEDRIACLENIIAINPMNVQARRRLLAYQQQAAEAGASETAAPTAPAPRKQVKTARPAKRDTNGPSKAKPAAKPRRRLGRILTIVIAGVLIGLLIAVLVSILLYGR